MTAWSVNLTFFSCIFSSLLDGSDVLLSFSLALPILIDRDFTCTFTHS